MKNPCHSRVLQSLWRAAHVGADFLAGAVACGGPILEQFIPEGLYPVERIHTRAVLQELQPVGRIYFGEVHEALQPKGGTPCWRRGTV